VPEEKKENEVKRQCLNLDLREVKDQVYSVRISALRRVA
jgi:hypothetical protein